MIGKISYVEKIQDVNDKSLENRAVHLNAEFQKKTDNNMHDVNNVENIVNNTIERDKRIKEIEERKKRREKQKKEPQTYVEKHFAEEEQGQLIDIKG